MTRLLAIILALSLLTAPAQAGEPMLVLQWSNATTHDFGMAGVIREGYSWPEFIREQVKPAIDWCKASGVTPKVVLHHPWGQYGTPMHLDGYDYAVAAKATWLTSNFASLPGWKSVTGQAQCYGYVGGVDLIERLRNLPPAELAATIRRNLVPFVEAGFRGVYVDYAENAIAHPFSLNAALHAAKSPNALVNPDGSYPSHPQDARASLDTLTLRIADAMFVERTGIEAAPRSYDQFRPLRTRDIILQDPEWRHRYDPALRHGLWKDLGYDKSVLKGEVWRTLSYSDEAKKVVAAAKAIVADGHTPVIYAGPLIRAGVKAREIFEP